MSAAHPDKIFQILREMRERGYDAPSNKEAVLRFIRSRVKRGDTFPTPKEISDLMGWKLATSAEDCLLTLCEDGFIEHVGRGDPRYRWSLTLQGQIEGAV